MPVAKPETGGSHCRRKVGMVVILTSAALGLGFTPEARGELGCNAGIEGFESGIGTWSSADLRGSGLAWGTLGACGEASNFTGASGDAACVSSDRHGVGAFETALVSPPISLADAASASVSFRLNYQSFSGVDRLTLELSADGGGSWQPIREFAGDRGEFRATAGDAVEADLSPWVGQPDVRLRFRYADASDEAFDWYAQVDDVQVRCDVAPACAPESISRPLADGGFEEGTPNSHWSEYSLNFGTPICTAASCGFEGAAAGSAWAFFGGLSGTAETASLEQSLPLPIGIAKLRFALWNPAWSGNGTDRLRFLADGDELTSITEGVLRHRDVYEAVAVDLSRYADGGEHVLRFEASTSGTPIHSNFFVDEVELEICTAVVENPEIRISDVSLNEGNLGLGTAVFTVTLSGPARQAVSVNFSTSSGTAISGSDFKPTSGSLAIPPGVTTRTIAVPVLGDTTDEPDETFYLDLSGATNGTVADGQGLGTIRNDDATFISITDGGALEPDDPATTSAVFTVNLSRPSSRSVVADYRTVGLSATGGVDFVSTTGSLSFAPGETRKTITVTVLGDRLSEHDERFEVRLENVLDAQLERIEGTGTIVDDDRGRVPVLGTDVLYTIDADFDFGRLLNVTYETPTHDQLQLVRSYSTYPYLWVAASSRGTIVKVDTRTGTILGEYSTNPDAGSAGFPNPSRTTVALDGSVWAGNRGDGSVVHVGLVEENQCVDRNGNGSIETSTGYGDVRPWPNAGGVDSGGGVATAGDECVLHYVKTSASIVRHVSIDRDNDVWVSGFGGTNPRVFQRIDGKTGAIEQKIGPLACGGYGGVVDAQGIVWSVTLSGPVLRWDPSVYPPTPQSLRCIGGVQAYGIALDRSGSIWVAAPGGDRVWKVSADGNTVTGPYRHGSAGAQGLAADAEGGVWVTSAKWGNAATVGHLTSSGQFLGNVARVPKGSTGVAVDRDGKVWVASYGASAISRIDPLAGPSGSDGRTPIGAVDLVVSLPGASPYNYSDMTGSLALASTSPRGTWTVVQDAGYADAPWGTIRWNQEAQGQIPAGADIRLEARAAASEAALGEQEFVAVENGVPFSLVGRFIEARVTLIPGAGGEGPVLSDLRITTGDDGTASKLSVENARFFETNAGLLATSMTVRLTPASASTVTVGFKLEDGNAQFGPDYTRTTNTGTLTFPAGTTSQSVALSIRGDLVAEDDEDFFLKLSNPTGGARIGDGFGVGEILDNDRWLSTVEGRDRTYTFNEDFDLGRLFNSNHDAPGEHQLQVSPIKVTYPYLWIAASNRGTVVKIDTRTGAILGEYSTNPDANSSSKPDPSRTTVALDGSVWAGNRGDRSIIHIGLLEEGQCVDRNGNGTIETSTGYNNVLAWPNPGNANSNGGVSKALDECILHYVKVSSSIPRHLSVDKDNNVWVSGRYGSVNAVFNYVNGQTGQILRTVGPMPCGGYGGLIDQNGIIWSSNQQGAVLRWDPSVDPPTAASRKCIPKYTDYRYSYGLAADSLGNIWVTGLNSNSLWRIPPSGSSVLGNYGHGTSSAQGLAVDSRDHVWVSSGYNRNDSRVGHVLPNGQLLGVVTGVPVGSSGVAIDAQGKIWVANYQSSTAARIDPNKGPIGSNGVDRVGAVDLVVQLPASTNPSRPKASPYNYSDMTGAIALQKTAPRGTWEVIQDGGLPGTVWGKVTWNGEEQGLVPEGASVLVEARAADTIAGLGGRPYVAVENGVGFTLVGRFLDVRVVLRPNLAGESPVLSDLRIQTGEFTLPALSIGDVTVFEGDSGSKLARVPLQLSSASTAEVLVDFDTVDGDAVAPGDYTTASGTAVIPAGALATEIEVPVLGDTLTELDETFVLDLLRPRGAYTTDGQGQVTILDDDVPAVLSVGDLSILEGDAGTQTIELTIHLVPAVDHTVVVDYTFVDGSATAGVDYSAEASYLNFAPGATSMTVTAEVVGDLETEDDETFSIVLSNPFGAELGQAIGIVTILDDDGVEVSIGDSSVVEGHSGTVPMVFPVALSGPARSALTLEYQVVAGTASHPDDYVVESGSISIAEGAVAAEIEVPVVGDLLYEGDETFRVVLIASDDIVLVDGEAVGTIVDDERCTSPNLLVNGDGEAALDFGAIPGWQALGGTWSFAYEPAPVSGLRSFTTATAATGTLAQTVPLAAFGDLLALGTVELEVSGWLRLRSGAPGDRAALEIDLLDADGQPLTSQLAGEASGAAAWEPVNALVAYVPEATHARVRLAGNGLFDAIALVSHGVPVLTIGDASAYEGDMGTSPMPFALALSCPVAEELTGAAATTDGTALGFDDYLPLATPFAIPSGATGGSLAVEVVGDELDEGHERFYLDLTSGGFPTLPLVVVDPRGIGTILDDDYCQRTHGYWMEHPELWPVGSLFLGDREYGREELLSLLAYTDRDMSSLLAKQLIATRLDLARGSEPSILPVVAEADAFLRLFPPGSDPRGPNRGEAERLKDLLDDYTNACEEVEVEP